ncbi:MAG TPA: acyl-CoA carboxylase epsilon subunit [Microbacteriaceae bacterium]|nr:acyl-CoA carboxylase epsilon subunit [Microbacteriaceae bacterium]
MIDGLELEPASELEAVSSQLHVTSRTLDADCYREDNAAAIAALAGMLIEESEARREAERGTDFWMQSARGLRAPLHPGPGAWRGFTG